MHLASPASPIDYAMYPIQTLKVGAMGTMNCLGLAKSKGAGFFISSTSEVYGDPLVHPQPETYWGNVNPIGPRGRATTRPSGTPRRWRSPTTGPADMPIRVVRIFNTHGPRMRRNDGRAVPTFIDQCLAGKPITVHGDGNQTRSLCYVDDLIEGFIRLLAYEGPAQPINVGNPGEATDPRRSPRSSKNPELGLGDHLRAPSGGRPPEPLAGPDQGAELLGWEPKVSLEEGLQAHHRVVPGATGGLEKRKATLFWNGKRS